MYSHPGYGTYESNMIDMLEWKNWNVEDPVQAQSNDSCQNAPLQPGEKNSLGQAIVRMEQENVIGIYSSHRR